VLKQLALSLSSHAFEAALAPLTKALGSGLAQLVGGGVASILPFASGGVIASPMAFPLGERKLGLAGEAGPEAILPLTRGKDGRLGVRAEGSAPPLNVTFNVTAQDAQSFRRSEGQIAAMLSRAVSRGTRNL
jgi:phage-related minor tail protein